MLEFIYHTHQIKSYNTALTVLHCMYILHSTPPTHPTHFITLSQLHSSPTLPHSPLHSTPLHSTPSHSPSTPLDYTVIAILFIMYTYYTALLLNTKLYIPSGQNRQNNSLKECIFDNMAL